MKLSVLGVALVLVGCATGPVPPVTVPARLYSSTGQVFEGSLTWRTEATGPATVSTTEGCTGEHSTLVDGMDTATFLALFSFIDASGGLLGAVRTTSVTPSLGTTSTTSKVRRGIAVVVCPSTEVLECEYSMNAVRSGITGFGTCKSNKNDTRYRFMLGNQ